jgi:TRAP transporter TAXI family solute receptor
VSLARVRTDLPSVITFNDYKQLIDSVGICRQVNKEPDNQNVGASVPVIAIIASLVAVAIIACGIYLYRVVSTEVAYRQIVIATGPETGTYHALGHALKRVLENSEAFGPVAVQATDGSVENMQLIAGEPGQRVDLAFVQGDASPSTNARLVTALYEEVLHILVSTAGAGDIQTIYDLQGKRVALGAAGAGTRELSRRVLLHFGIEVAEDLIVSPEQVAQGLTDGSIDAAFMLTAIPSKLIAGLANRGAIRFLSLGSAEEIGDEAHALERVFPGVKRNTIPRATYVKLPRKAVHTVSVTAMLVAREDLDEKLVRSVTAMILANRSGASGLEGNALTVARNIRENYQPAVVSIPYHPGAVSYYQREEPPFFVEYAEALSLGLTLMLAIYSVFIALREWFRRRMKNRVDAYLLQVESLAAGLNGLDHDALVRQKTLLEEVRRTVFADLVAERLLADAAFLILQNHLRDELAAIEARILEVPKRD